MDNDNKILLNLGCGDTRPANWINTDSSLNAQLQRIPYIGKIIATQVVKSSIYSNSNVTFMNLNKKWKFDDNSVDVVYASHLFEHLSLKSADLFLKEAYRTLKPGGVIRIVVPDLYSLAKKYVLEYEQGKENATKDFLWAINLHKENMYPSNKKSLIRSLIYSIQDYPHQHKYMYDQKTLKELLMKYHFKNILCLSYGKSEYIREIDDVEGDKEHYISIYLEGEK